MPGNSYTVDLNEHRQPVNQDSQKWLDNILFGEDEAASAAPPPAPARPDNNQAVQDTEAQRRLAELTREVSDLQKKVNDGGKAVQDTAPRMQPEEIEDLTEEEKKLIFGENGPAASNAMRKFVIRAAHEQSKKQEARLRETSKAYEDRIAKLEEESRNLRASLSQSSAESRAGIVSSQINAAMPHVSQLYNHPAMADFLGQRLSTPAGEVTRQQLLMEAQNHGNAAYIIGELRQFERQIGASEERPISTAAPARPSPNPPGNPSLSTLGRNVQRRPNIQRLTAAYDALAEKVKTGTATSQDTQNYEAAAREIMKYRREQGL